MRFGTSRYFLINLMYFLITSAVSPALELRSMYTYCAIEEKRNHFIVGEQVLLPLLLLLLLLLLVVVVLLLLLLVVVLLLLLLLTPIAAAAAATTTTTTAGAGIAWYIDPLRAGRPGDRIPVGDEIFPACPDRPWGAPRPLYCGYRLLPGDKAAWAWR